jgi:hypothetical protein
VVIGGWRGEWQGDQDAEVRLLIFFLQFWRCALRVDRKVNHPIQSPALLALLCCTDLNVTDGGTILLLKHRFDPLTLLPLEAATAARELSHLFPVTFPSASV